MRVVLLALPILLGACGASPVLQAAAAPGHPSGPPSFPEDERAFLPFHSMRFHVALPLPDGRGWRVDDHSRPELVATHGATRSILLLRLSIEQDLMSRQKCEARARELGLVKDEGLSTVEDAVTVGPGPYDTRTWVALSARAPGQRLVGHLYAFGGYVRHCLIFHFASEVPSDEDEGVLSSRLAVARTRILGGIELEPFDAPAREAH